MKFGRGYYTTEIENVLEISKERSWRTLPLSISLLVAHLFGPLSATSIAPFVFAWAKLTAGIRGALFIHDANFALFRQIQTGPSNARRRTKEQMNPNNRTNRDQNQRQT